MNIKQRKIPYCTNDIIKPPQHVYDTPPPPPLLPHPRAFTISLIGHIRIIGIGLELA